MSEILHSRERRRELLKDIIRDLHNGKSVDEVKPRFQSLIKDIGSTEIAGIEQDLIREGLPESEIKRLCNVHVAVFKDALDKKPEPKDTPGHPLHTFRAENRALEEVIREVQALLPAAASPDESVHRPAMDQWPALHAQLMQADNHYARKENLLFPYLEKAGITGPTAVMWSTDDDIRDGLKKTDAFLASKEKNGSAAKLIDDVVKPMLQAMNDMIYKEEHVLFPMAADTLTEDEWAEVHQQSDGVGYTLTEPSREWKPARVQVEAHSAPMPVEPGEASVSLDTGALTPRQINAMLKSLPIDITFVDRENVVRYFSASKDRVFLRTPAIIGRRVEKCHPPESVHVVEKIVEDFKSGKRTHADFWINMGGKLVYIRYFAVHDDDGKYLGVAEVTQDITEIRKLEGQKRLLDEREDTGAS